MNDFAPFSSPFFDKFIQLLALLTRVSTMHFAHSVLNSG